MKHYIAATGEEWLRQFEAIRNAFLERLSIVSHENGVGTFRLCGTDGEARSWRGPRDFGPDTANLQEAQSFIAYRIDEGFCAAFCLSATDTGRAEVWLTSWEDPDALKWPTSLNIVHEELHEGIFRAEAAPES